MLLDVVKVQACEHYVLLLEFENGECRKMDMSSLLQEKPFDSLKDEHIFFSARVAHGTVAWQGNLDIAPETLYDLSTVIN